MSVHKNEIELTIRKELTDQVKNFDVWETKDVQYPQTEAMAVSDFQRIHV
jgi:hypothetical protein